MSQTPFHNDAVLDCLNHFSKKQIEKVKKALVAGNPIYAIYVSLAILKHHPRNAALRTALRKTQNAVQPIPLHPLLHTLQTIKAWLRFTPKWTYAYFLFTRNNTDQAIYLCEEILCEYPHFYLAHYLQFLAAKNINDLPTQILALQSMLQCNPHNLNTQLHLAQSFLANHQYPQAEKIAELILSQNPNHFTALQIARKAIAARIRIKNVATE